MQISLKDDRKEVFFSNNRKNRRDFLNKNAEKREFCQMIAEKSNFGKRIAKKHEIWVKNWEKTRDSRQMITREDGVVVK